MAWQEPDVEETILRGKGHVAIADQTLHVLLLREPGRTPRHIPLGALPLSIGRIESNGLVLPTQEVSRRHCVARVVDGEVRLADLGSTNGTFVNGSRIEGEVVLAQDAKIGVGPFVLQYRQITTEEISAAEEQATEVARAARYIDGLLPPKLSDGPVRAEWRFVPCGDLGGDGFGYRWLDGTRFAIYMLDVAGHGLGSALLAVSVMNVLRLGTLGRADPADPVAVLEALNAAFPMEAHGGLFFPVWYGVFDTESRTLHYACAGHHPGFLLTSGEVVPRALGTKGPAIGIRDAARWMAEKVNVPPGSALFLFSDGAFEITDSNGRVGRMEDLLPLLAPADGTQPGAADRLFDSIRRLSGLHSFEDDVSVLSVAFP